MINFFNNLFLNKNFLKIKVKSNHLRDFTYFASKNNEQKMPICEQTLVATFQFLSASMYTHNISYIVEK